MTETKTLNDLGSNAGLERESDAEMLAAFDAYARSLVAHPHPMEPKHWPKHWPFFYAGWRAAMARSNV